MGKHTSGPWTLDERFDIPGIVGADGFEVAELPALCISPAWRDANPDKHWGNHKSSHIDRPLEEHDANARLIAAAPDLLAACKAYLYGQKDGRECEAMMREAIAKAEATS